MKDLEQKIRDLEKINKELVLINSELETAIKYFEQELAKETRKNIFDKILLKHYQGLFSGAVANFLLDPNPIELKTQGTRANGPATHLVQIKNIAAVQSDMRIKKIYLIKSQTPIGGGPEENPLVMNSKESKWEKILHSIQGNQEFLFRVHKSHAINIYHYTLGADKVFKINETLKSGVSTEVHLIPIDSKFDSLAYQKRLLEINRLIGLQMGLDFEKVEEIARYIKTPLVTNG